MNYRNDNESFDENQNQMKHKSDGAEQHTNDSQPTNEQTNQQPDQFGYGNAHREPYQDNKPSFSEEDNRNAERQYYHSEQSSPSNDETMSTNRSNGLNAPKKPKQTTLTKQKKRKSGGHFFSGILGGMVSAVLIIGLLFSGVLPAENFTSNHSGDIESSQTDSQPSGEATQAINLDNTNEEVSGIDTVSKAVVGIKNMQQENIWDPGQEAGSGSGIIYKKENGKAYIVTNNHVVENAKKVEVVLNDEEQVQANVLGTDTLTDLAVLEIDDEKVDVVADLGSSEDLSVGETVLAIGNPLGQEFYGSVTRGIISGLNRSVEVDTNGDQQPDWITEVIQTDTAINPGNSGGALVNTNGEIIGINSIKVAQEAVEGIGFAIPIDSALPIMEQLESDGEITRPYIGVSTAAIEQVPMQYRDQIELPEEIDEGMVIANVETGSPADKAGLQQFDVITKIDGEDITSTLDLRRYLYKETKVGDKTKVEFYRDGEKQQTELKLAEREV